MKKTYFFTVVILTMVVSLALNSYGKGKDNSSTQFDRKTVQNFIIGINSENNGLCESCIYYAGYYKVRGTVESLINVLNNSYKKPSLRILAAVSLYRIGDLKGIRAIRDIVQFDKTESVRIVCSKLYNEYLNQVEFFCTAGF